MKTHKNSSEIVITELTDREHRICTRRMRQQRERKRAFYRKCATFFITACLILVCAVSYHSIESSASTGGTELNFKYYKNIIVESGETLWQIADQYIDYNEYTDKKTYIAEVKSINHLDEEASVKEGQYLIVPYYSNQFVK